MCVQMQDVYYIYRGVFLSVIFVTFLYLYTIFVYCYHHLRLLTCERDSPSICYQTVAVILPSVYLDTPLLILFLSLFLFAFSYLYFYLIFLSLFLFAFLRSVSQHQIRERQGKANIYTEECIFQAQYSVAEYTVTEWQNIQLHRSI